jgi:transcription elongation factor Elf1
MPTIYAQRLTPTDIKQLQDENQKLRNQVLDRMFACPICDEEFETYDKDQIRAHCRLHQQQLEEAGQCPSCCDPQWVFMTNFEKRSHFAMHQDQHESAKIKDFYKSQRCPVCDVDLSKTKPEQVIRHCLEHSPGQFRFCDRCGLNERDCNAEELSHHHFKCRLADDRQAGDPEPVFCKNCGLNTTRATPEQNQAHLKQCHEGPPGRFCIKCGLNETDHLWNRPAIAKHDSHCTPPSGFHKKFCEKCGIEVASMNTTATALHQMTCGNVDPPDLSDDRARLIGPSSLAPIFQNIYNLISW